MDDDDDDDGLKRAESRRLLSFEYNDDHISLNLKFLTFYSSSLSDEMISMAFQLFVTCGNHSQRSASKQQKWTMQTY